MAAPWGIPMSGANLAKPGTDAHLAVTFPMGSSSVNGTNSAGELKETRGLRLVDGLVLPSLPSKHTTLTIMANADRIGRSIVSDWRQ